MTSSSAGEVFQSLSDDRCTDDVDAATYPVEWLNNQKPTGMPAHDLKLKVGMPIILLRNLNSALGLANGTRLTVTAFPTGGRLIQARVLTGTAAGSEVLIPRIKLNSDTTNMPVEFSRRQFPVRPAFAMTINKSQGQTLQRVGIYLPVPVFTHGQLYVAMSRVGLRAGVSIMLPHECRDENGVAHTPNVVYREILT